MIQILVAENSSIIRSTLKEIISKSSKLKLIGEAVTVDELKAAVNNTQPDLIIIEENFFGREI